MKIEVTGCNNCPFRYHDYEYGYICSYDMNSESSLVTVDIRAEKAWICRTDIPHNCPITLNGGTITVTTKSE